jgi:hypothetical protein
VLFLHPVPLLVELIILARPVQAPHRRAVQDAEPHPRARQLRLGRCLVRNRKVVAQYDIACMPLLGGWGGGRQET